MLIIFEGIEGVGKTTHLQLLAESLKKEGFPVVASTQEPGWGEDHLSGILKHLINQPSVTTVEKLFLLLADRAGHYARFIRPLLNEKHCRPIILCERGPDSTIAYQGFGMNMLPPGPLNNLNMLATGGICSSMTILLDTKMEIAIPRSTKAKKIDLTNENVRNYYERVQKGYHHMMEGDAGRYLEVNTSQDIETVHKSIFQAVIQRLTRN